MKNTAKPIVSIITVCYNSSETIRDTIESVINQTYKHSIEYIIIDGKSTDSTLKVINEYSDSIAIVLSEKDDGIYDAINKGIRLANGKYVGILNADDFYINSSVIENVINELELKVVDSLYADLYYVDPVNTNKVIRYWKSGNFKKNKFLFGWMPPHPTFFITKEAYQKYGVFNTELRSAADYELMLRMLFKHEITVTYLKEVVVRMRTGGVSNVSFKNRIKANREDKRAWIINNLKYAPYTFIAKPLRKVTQYLFK